MLKLICGPSGAGKTALVTDAIRQDIENGTRCYLLVPEQQAYISERDLPAALPKNAGLFFEIVNFSGLCNDVFRKHGGGRGGSIHSGLRTVLMWETLRSSASMLGQYKSNVGNDTSLPAKMLAAIDELRINNVSANQIEEVANELPENSSLRRKLKDLALIDAMYHKTVEDRFGEDPSDKLTRLAKALEKHRYFDGCNVYVDSFAGFTAEEFSVIFEILKQADCVTVTLCADTFQSRLPQFAVVKETIKRLKHLAQRANAEIKEISLSAPVNQKPLQLEILERDLWRFDAKKDERLASEDQKSDPAVELYSCSNLYEESELIAWKILELIEGGMHYGDIALVVRDTETYRGVLDAALEKYDIPFFLSERTDLSSKPLARLILSALWAVALHYRRQDVITLIKTGLAGVDVRDGSLFEEYCETWHISGARFADEGWSMNPDGLTEKRSARADEILAAANKTRKTVMEPLLALETALRASKKLSDRCRAVYDYLCALNVPYLLSVRAEDELSKGERRRAGETLRLYDFITQTLTTLADLLPSSELSIEEFISVLGLLFAESDMGSIPTTHDCVIVGSAPTLRVENVKASFLLGLCEGEFPRAITDDGLLTEADKVFLEQFDIRFDSRLNSRSADELMYVYRAMSKPSRKLVLSTVRQQPDGAERMPSLAFSRAQILLNQKPVSVNVSDVKSRLTQVPTEAPTTELRLCPYPDRSTLRLSQTSIQTFALCPYRYYSTYFLKLRGKKDATPALADDGTFLHYVFENFLKRSLGEDGKLHLPKEEEIEDLTDEIISEYLDEVYPLPPSQMDQRLLHLFNRLRKHALKVLLEIVSQLRVGEFIPTHFEKSLGSKDLPTVKLELENGSSVILNGTVDRIDLYEKDGSLYVSVVDYKAGSHDAFSVKNVRSGMDIQLVLYLYAILASDPRMKAASAQYLFAKTEHGITEIKRTGLVLDDPAVLDALDNTEEKQSLNGLSRQSADQIDALQEDMKQTVKEIATRILSGEAQKCPSEDACKFCPVCDLCDVAYHK